MKACFGNIINQTNGSSTEQSSKDTGDHQKKAIEFKRDQEE